MDEYNDKVIHTVRQSFPVPSVIRLTKARDRKSRRLRLTKKGLYLRDKGRCQYCGERLRYKESTMDHVHPKSKGGRATWTNIVLACVDCNQKKANLTVKEAQMCLLTQPVRPKNIEFIKGNIPESWKFWLSGNEN